MFPKGWKQKEQAALARREQRKVSAEVRAQRASVLAGAEAAPVQEKAPIQIDENLNPAPKKVTKAKPEADKAKPEADKE